MAYATRADAEELYGLAALELAADMDYTADGFDGKVGRALSDATDICDSYIGLAYTLPLAVVPSILKGACIDIAIYRLALGANRTEEMRLRYEDALKWLALVAAGKALLNPADTDDDGDVEEVTSSGWPMIAKATRG